MEAGSPFAAPADFLITIFDGNQKQIHRDFHKEAVLHFDCPFFDCPSMTTSGTFIR
jgi:hypothetical protein